MKKITFEDKKNRDAVISRKFQSTAEDWNEVKDCVNTLVDYVDNLPTHSDVPGVVDNLTTNSPDASLSASMGVLIKRFIDDILKILSSDDTTLDELQEIVSFIKQNKETLDNLTMGNIAGLFDYLTEMESRLLAKFPILKLSNSPVRSRTLHDRFSKVFSAIGDSVRSFYHYSSIKQPDFVPEENYALWHKETTEIYFLVKNDAPKLLPDSPNLKVKINAFTDFKNENDPFATLLLEVVVSSTPVSLVEGYTAYKVTYNKGITGGEAKKEVYINTTVVDMIDQTISEEATPVAVFSDRDFFANRPHTILPAPGENKYYNIKSIVITSNLSTVYAGSNSLNIKLGDAHPSRPASLRLDVEGKYIYTCLMQAVSGGEDATGGVINRRIINQPLTVSTPEDSTGGKGTISFYVDYEIISI